jgi:monoamine oxidase
MALIIAESKRITWGVPFEEQGLEDLDIPLSDWLADKGISGHTLEIVSSYGPALCFGVAPESLSALHAISWVTGSGNSAWELFLGPTIKFANGTSSLYERLAEGVEVKVSTPVSDISQTADSVSVAAEDGSTFEARTAIIAVPLNTWKNISFSPALQPQKEEFTKEELAGHDVKLWAQVRDIPDYSAALGWDTPLQWLSCEFLREEGSVMCGFAFDETEMNPKDRHSVERAIRAYFPEAELVNWWSEDWNDSPYSMGTWTAFRPGQITRFGASSRQAEGLLSFATADVAVGFSGWIEGALESGATASQETLA